MLFSRKNPPSGFYHYLYLREDSTPYYSGKGCGRRAWDKNHNVKLPTDSSRIVITHWGLTELWALAMERWHIRWYGRKDLGTGILCNMTSGGDGVSSEDQLAAKNPMYDHTIYDFIHKDGRTESCTQYDLRVKYNLDAGHLSRVILHNRPSVSGWRLLSYVAKPRKDRRCSDIEYHFVHKDGSEFTGTQRGFMLEYTNMKPSYVSRLVNNDRRTFKGWMLP